MFNAIIIICLLIAFVVSSVYAKKHATNGDIPHTILACTDNIIIIMLLVFLYSK